MIQSGDWCALTFTVQNSIIKCSMTFNVMIYIFIFFGLYSEWSKNIIITQLLFTSCAGWPMAFDDGKQTVMAKDGVFIGKFHFFKKLPDEGLENTKVICSDRKAELIQ